MARYPKDSSPKLTEELIEKISEALKMGSYVETAVAYCGISKDTFYRWLRMAVKDDADGMYRKLSDAIQRSWAEAEMRDLEVLNKAALGSPDRLEVDENGNVVIDSDGFPVVAEYGLAPNWRVSAWRLERKFPERWGRKARGETMRLEEKSSISVVFVDSE